MSYCIPVSQGPIYDLHRWHSMHSMVSKNDKDYGKVARVTYSKSLWSEGMSINPPDFLPPTSTPSLINAPLVTIVATTVNCNDVQLL